LWHWTWADDRFPAWGIYSWSFQKLWRDPFLRQDLTVHFSQIKRDPWFWSYSCRHPYRAYIEILLSYGPAAKESQLTGVMWYKDTPEHQDKRTTDNKGFTSRKALTVQSKYVQMTGILHLDSPAPLTANL
jgi:hypothetical protein